MPTTTRSRTTQKRGSVLERDPELEGLGIAPGNRGAARLPGAPRDRRSLASELIDEAVDGAAGRRRLRHALGMPSGRRISNDVIDELLAGASSEEGAVDQVAGGVGDGGRVDRSRRL